MTFRPSRARVLLLLCLCFIPRPQAAGERSGSPAGKAAGGIDEARVLEDLVIRSVVTGWGGLRVLVPPERQGELVAPLARAARRFLDRPETADLAGDVLDLHEKGALVPVLEALRRSLESPGPAGASLEALSGLPAAARPDLEKIEALLTETTAALDAGALAKLAASVSAIPNKSWEAADELSMRTLRRGALERTARFIAAGPEPGRGFEAPRRFIPPALCIIDEKNLKPLESGTAYLAGFNLDPRSAARTVAVLQWFANQTREEKALRIFYNSLVYKRLPQLLGASRKGIEDGVLREVMLDYADYLSGRDKRVKVSPEMLKQLQAGTLPEDKSGDLSAVELVKLGTLTLAVLDKLDQVPSAPRPNGLKQTLGDEILDFLDYQLAKDQRSSAFPLLFDAARELLSPSPESRDLLRFTRDFSGYMNDHDPQPLLGLTVLSLGCDPELASAKAGADLLDGRTENGDLRILLPLVGPFSVAPPGRLEPFLRQTARLRGALLKLAPAARAALVREREDRVPSALLVRLAEGDKPLLPALDPLARGLAREAPAFRRLAPRLDEKRIGRWLALARASAAAGESGASDLRETTEALAAWSSYRNPLTGRSLLADAGLFGLESVKSGLVKSILDAGVLLRKREGREGVKRFLEALGAALAPEPAPAVAGEGEALKEVKP